MNVQNLWAALHYAVKYKASQQTPADEAVDTAAVESDKAAEARLRTDAQVAILLAVGRLAMMLRAPTLKDQERGLAVYPWWGWALVSCFYVAALGTVFYRSAKPDEMTSGIFCADFVAFVLQVGYYEHLRRARSLAEVPA